MPEDVASAEAITAAWRAESARLVGALTRITRDVDLAEDLAQDALVAALEQWPAAGVPDNPAAWLMTAAKRRGMSTGMSARAAASFKHTPAQNSPATESFAELSPAGMNFH